MQSYYQKSRNQKLKREKLKGHINTDICVIGGGYTGLSSALYLAKKNISVVVLEAHKIACGASGANGGQISGGMCKDQPYIEKIFGKETALALWKIGEKARLNVVNLINEYNIKCDYKQGIAHPLHKKRYQIPAQRYVEHLQNNYNYDSIEYLDQNQMKELCGSNTYYGGYYDKKAAHCHPLNYALGIAKAAIDAKAKIYENSKVLSYKLINNKLLIKTKDATINADRIIIACNGYLENIEPQLNKKILPINNYIIATEVLDNETLTKINPKDIAFADSRFVVNYYRLSADKRLLFGGGENYTQYLTNNIVPIVTKPMIKIYPFLKEKAIEYAWGAKLAITMNRMPVFKTFNNEKILSAQGYCGHGVALASYTGKIIADKISGKDKAFDIMASIKVPNFPGGSLLRNINMKLGMAYYAILDYL